MGLAMAFARRLRRPGALRLCARQVTQCLRSGTGACWWCRSDAGPCRERASLRCDVPFGVAVHVGACASSETHLDSCRASQQASVKAVRRQRAVARHMSVGVAASVGVSVCWAVSGAQVRLRVVS